MVKKIPFTTHLQLHLTKLIKRGGTESDTSSIIKSGQKDTEASIIRCGKKETFMGTEEELKKRRQRKNESFDILG